MSMKVTEADRDDEVVVERVATAICRQPGSICSNFCRHEKCPEAIRFHSDDARAAIAAIGWELLR